MADVDRPADTIRTRISPEYNQFTLSTGDSLQLASELGCRGQTPGRLGVTDRRGVLFALPAGPIELDITIERWESRDQPPDVDSLNSLHFEIDATEPILRLTSITPSPDDVTITLPRLGSYTGHALVLDRSSYLDTDFDLQINTET